MSGTVGDFFVRRLHEWGVRRIFGYPGDGINGVLGALQRGAAHLITGLYDAKCDHMPVLAISGQAPRTARRAVLFLHHCREKDG